MRSKMMLLVFVALLMMVSPVFAQGTNGAPMNITPAASVIGMAIASGLCGLAQGKAIAGAAEGMARNPGAAAAIRGALILGLVLIESLALYTLVVVFTR
jgi:F-type H+-transporting ATPase subunit c